MKSSPTIDLKSFNMQPISFSDDSNTFSISIKDDHISF